MKIRAGRSGDGDVYLHLDDLVATLTQAPPDVQPNMRPTEAFAALGRALERYGSQVPKSSGLIVVNNGTKIVPG